MFDLLRYPGYLVQRTAVPLWAYYDVTVSDVLTI